MTDVSGLPTNLNENPDYQEGGAQAGLHDNHHDLIHARLKELDGVENYNNGPYHPIGHGSGGGAIGIDFSRDQHFVIQAGGNITDLIPTNVPPAGQIGVRLVAIEATANITITTPSSIDVVDPALPTSLSAGDKILLELVTYS